MKTYELRILTDAIITHCKRKKLDEHYKDNLHKDVDESIDYWEDKYSKEANTKFTNHFQKVLAEHFTEGCLDALYDRYKNELTYQEIGDKYNYTKTCAEQKVKAVLEKIPKIKIWRELLFDEMYVPMAHIIVSKDTIYNSPLSCRARNCLTRYLDRQSKLFGVDIKPTTDNIAKYIPDLRLLYQCGARTRREIINYFKELGYNETVNNWELKLLNKEEELMITIRKREKRAKEREASITK